MLLMERRAPRTRPSLSREAGLLRGQNVIAPRLGGMTFLPVIAAAVEEAGLPEEPRAEIELSV